jgi:hypothetical protein
MGARAGSGRAAIRDLPEVQAAIVITASANTCVHGDRRAEGKNRRRSESSKVVSRPYRLRHMEQALKRYVVAPKEATVDCVVSRGTSGYLGRA